MTYALNPREDQEQETVAQFLDLLKKQGRIKRWCHIPNGGMRPQRTSRGKTFSVESQKLKRQGLKPGAPDILIFDTPPQYPDKKGLAIELKRLKGGKVTTEQREWNRDLKSLGWIAAFCHGADEAINLIQSVGY